MKSILPKNHYMRLRQRGVTGISRQLMKNLRIEVFKAFQSQNETRAKDIANRMTILMKFQKESNLRSGMPFDDIAQVYPTTKCILNMTQNEFEKLKQLIGV